MLTQYRCTPSQVANNPHSCESNPFPVKQFVTQAKMPFTKAFIGYYSCYARTFSRISHYCLTELETGNIALISPSVTQSLTRLGQCTISKCLFVAPHLQHFLTIQITSVCHYSGNMHTVHFCKQVLTTLSKCTFKAQNDSTTRIIQLNPT
jgi:hypothetical protein